MTIPIKNKAGIAKMREACAIAATVLEELKPLVRPGITTQDLEETGRDSIARLGARSACYGYQHGSRRYPAHACISVNDEVVHGIPSLRRVLREGDLVSLDIVVWYDGYVGDSRVFDQAIFNFRWTDAITGRLEHVVSPTLVPEIAVFID